MSGQAAEIDLKCDFLGLQMMWLLLLKSSWAVMFKKVLINLTKERGWERPKLAAVSQAYIAQDSNSVKAFVS